MKNFLAQLRYSDFDVEGIESYKMSFENGNTVDYLQSPRRKNLFHLVTGGKRFYEIDSRSFFAPCGTLIFIPDNTYYKTTAFSCGRENCGGIGICFDIKGANLGCKSDVYITRVGEPLDRLKDLFQLVYITQRANPLELLKIKSEFYNLLSFLTAPVVVKSSDYAGIEKAVDFIHKHYKENLPVKLYAESCNLSESYFRKKFGEFFGKSPIDYRNRLRFAEAKRLYQNNYSLQEIADKLGFCDVSFMTKLYKRHTGRSIKQDAKII